jgi:hypothetical protein
MINSLFRRKQDCAICYRAGQRPVTAAEFAGQGQDRPELVGSGCVFSPEMVGSTPI